MTTAYEASALVVGLIADGRLNHMQVADGGLIEPWARAVKELKKSPQALTDKKERDKILGSCLMPSLIQEAHTEARRLNGLGEEGVFDFVGLADDKSRAYTLAGILDRTAKAAKEGRDGLQDMLLNARYEIDSLIAKRATGLRFADEINDEEYIPYVKSGINWVDDILQGWPTSGLIVVIAPEYTGKSYLGFYAACSWAQAHPELPPVAIYTLEMPAEDYKKRSLHAYPQFKELLNQRRVMISSSARNVGSLTAEISTHDVSFVVIDHIGYLVKEESTSEYSRAYKTLVEAQRLKSIPIMVFSQTSRENKKSGGFLDKWTAEWSSEAEQSAAMLLTLNKYDPAIDTSKDDRFPCTQDNPAPGCANHNITPRYFVCVWKDRNAAMKLDLASGQVGTGAIRIEPNPTTGYYDQLWVGPPHKGKLWGVNQHVKEFKTSAPTAQPQHTGRRIIKMNGE